MNAALECAMSLGYYRLNIGLAANELLLVT
jgi:hypothetical protein